jgi:tetratricopeptide (TPR) repeat protein
MRKQPAPAKKLFLVFGIWYLVFLSPALNIVPLNMTLAERWQYFPSVGLLAMIILAIFSFFEKHPRRADFAAMIMLAALIPPLAIRTAVRDGNWRKGLTLYGHDIRHTGGNNANLENNYGVELFRVGRTAEAKTHFEKSVALMDDWSVSQNNLGAIYENEGDLEKAREYYQRSIGLSDYYLAYQNMAGILMKLEKDDEAEAFIRNALQKFPSNPDFYFQLAVINYKKENLPEARKLLEQSLYLNPQNPDAQQLYTTLRSGQDIKFKD